MMLQIFPEFIDEVEGNKTIGYVPKDDEGPQESGVTIGTGLDLGQHDADFLESLCLPRDIFNKLLPYLGRVGEDAKEYLLYHPLVLSRSECDIINKTIRHTYLSKLASAYNAESKEVLFAALPPQLQTAIFSVYLQYGDLKRRCPRFWSFVIGQKWEAAHKELLNFGDSFGTRRRKEAALIETILWRK